MIDYGPEPAYKKVFNEQTKMWEVVPNDPVVQPLVCFLPVWVYEWKSKGFDEEGIAKRIAHSLKIFGDTITEDKSKVTCKECLKWIHA